MVDVELVEVVELMVDVESVEVVEMMADVESVKVVELVVDVELVVQVVDVELVVQVVDVELVMQVADVDVELVEGVGLVVDEEVGLVVDMELAVDMQHPSVVVTKVIMERVGTVRICLLLKRTYSIPVLMKVEWMVQTIPPMCKN
ncbi:hypothetical protein PF002_g30942 [Phytophthora fragariae]|uniref:Uncharacterized protein n=1 Tax=Phytophthora fragariae TaxID=53985 RepID=A0A6A3VK31_9STRA|nr:hypothetical protein PF003_g34862 [Phytophthora fragariae]KAE9167188.1 hypothetical protein PF002_g30942 [Phytophthora fragariae]